MNKAQKGIRFLDRVLNALLFTVLFLTFLLCVFSLWENKQIEYQSKAERFEQFKPPKGNNLPFGELKALNPDVVSWLEVYGTGIDYPVAYTSESNAYINKDIYGKHSVSGSIFIDFQNSPDFTDFTTTIHGHHMVGSAMFGDVGRFANLSYFEDHPYGKILTPENTYKGLSFFAFLEVSAYDPVIYGHHDSEDERLAFLDYINSTSSHIRPIDVSPTDHLVILSTCSQDETSGRYVLIGKITDEVMENTFVGSRGTGWITGNTDIWIFVAFVIVLVVLLVLNITERKGSKK